MIFIIIHFYCTLIDDEIIYETFTTAPPDETAEEIIYEILIFNLITILINYFTFYIIHFTVITFCTVFLNY